MTAPPIVLPPHVRQRCEAIVERLLALLDACDPEPDLEDDGEAGAPYKLGDQPLRFDAFNADAEPGLSVPEPDLVGCHWRRAGQCDDDREGDLADTADDREHDEGESGIADYDGLDEQRQR